MLKLLSLGAGVQSTVLALMTADGTLPRVDAAIFADTGWEPATVYRHLDRLAVVLDAAGIPLHRVSNGNLRADSLDPAHRYASIPYFVRNPDGSDGMGRRQCTAEYKLAPIGRKARELLGAQPRTSAGCRRVRSPSSGSVSPPTRSVGCPTGTACPTSGGGTRCWSWACPARTASGG